MQILHPTALTINPEEEGMFHSRFKYRSPTAAAVIASRSVSHRRPIYLTAAARTKTKCGVAEARTVIRNVGREAQIFSCSFPQLIAKIN